MTTIIVNDLCQDVSDIEAAREDQPMEGGETSPPEGARKWSYLSSKNLELIPYGFLLLIGLPIAYAANYTMPLFLGLNVLLFHAINTLSPKVKRLANPVLVTGLTMILCVYLFTLTKSSTLLEGLHLPTPTPPTNFTSAARRTSHS